jgi:hypothetical protein
MSQYVANMSEGPGSDVADSALRFLLPVERGVGVLLLRRVKRVQQNDKDLVAGAYILLAAMWGFLASLAGIAFLLLLVTGVDGPAIIGVLLGVVFLLGMGLVRRTQCQRSRRR